MEQLIAAEDQARETWMNSDAFKGGLERYDSKEYKTYMRAVAAVNRAVIRGVK